MANSQNFRDKRAIRTILSQVGEATYPEIALRGGEGLASPLLEMVQAGEVIRTEDPDGKFGFRVFYKLSQAEQGPVCIMGARGVNPSALDRAVREQDEYYGK